MCESFRMFFPKADEHLILELMTREMGLRNVTLGRAGEVTRTSAVFPAEAPAAVGWRGMWTGREDPSPWGDGGACGRAGKLDIWGFSSEHRQALGLSPKVGACGYMYSGPGAEVNQPGKYGRYPSDSRPSLPCPLAPDQFRGGHRPPSCPCQSSQGWMLHLQTLTVHFFSPKVVKGGSVSGLLQSLLTLWPGFCAPNKGVAPWCARPPHG